MTKPAPRARQRKIHDASVGELCKLIAGGMPLDHACAKLGFARQTLDEARQRHPEWDEQVRQAQTAGAEWYREQVMHAEGQDWKRWAWLGERLHPRVFGPAPQRVEQSGPDGGAQRHEHNVTITRDEAISIARRKGE